MNEGDGRETPDEFAHLFRPDSDSLDAAPGNDDPDVVDDPGPPADPFSDWEPLVAVPQAVPEATPQGGVRFDDPPLPAEPAPPDAIAVDEIEIEVDDVEIAVDEIEIEVDELDMAAASITPPPAAKEGRLFRSRGAPERDDAITAVGSMQARRLRTMTRAAEPGSTPDEAVVVEEFAPQPAPVFPIASSSEPAPALQIMAGVTQPDPEETVRPGNQPPPDGRQMRREQRREQQRRTGSGSLTGLGVYAVTIGVTVILAFGETLFFGGEPGVITGIGLLIVSIFAAFTVRTNDGIHAIFAPPIAFLVASLTAGQVGVNEAGLTGRAVVVFFLLGGNWVWIVGSTAAALVIVALRRRVG